MSNDEPNAEDDDSIDVETGHVPFDEDDAMGGGAYDSREDFVNSAVDQLESAIDDIEGTSDDETIVVGMSIEIVGVQADSVSEASQQDVVFTNGRALDPTVPITIAPAVFMHANDALIDNSFNVGLRDQIENGGPQMGDMAAMGPFDLSQLFGGSDDSGGAGPFPF